MKVLHGDNKHNDDHLRSEIEINGGNGPSVGGRRRSSTNSQRTNQNQVNFQTSVTQQQQQIHRPHPHARSKDISKQNIIAHQKSVVGNNSQHQGGGVSVVNHSGKKANNSSSVKISSSSEKEENTYQYYPSYNPHNPNASVRPPDSPEQFGWAYGVNSCDSNHCSNCIINAPGGINNGGHLTNDGSYCVGNNTNSLNR